MTGSENNGTKIMRPFIVMTIYGFRFLDKQKALAGNKKASSYIVLVIYILPTTFAECVIFHFRATHGVSNGNKQDW